MATCYTAGAGGFFSGGKLPAMAELTLAICARNAPHIIGACLESIYAQTVPPDDLIVAVDDADDPTIPVARAHGARVIVSGATGLYEARNAVLRECDTEYLAFTDADCVLVPDWVEQAKQVLDERPSVAAGTGRHPPVGSRNLAAWLHHMWYVVETTRTGFCDHVIGGNSYFRTDAVRAVGGWLPLSRHSAAEDLYISEALRRAGYAVWFEEGIAARHDYERSLRGLWRKSVMMGRDIVVMLRAAGWKDSPLWPYTLLIPMLPLLLVIGVVMMVVDFGIGAAIAAMPLFGSFGYLFGRFKSVHSTLPRWVARWVLIWPYSWGILQGLLIPVPKLPADVRVFTPSSSCASSSSKMDA